MSSSAVEHQECPICCDPLHTAVVVCLTQTDGRRIKECRHLYHKKCLDEYEQISNNTTCACCRVSYQGKRTMPNPLADPRGWFEFADQDHSGHLSIQELTEALKGFLPVDWRKIDSDSENLWPIWDKD